MKFCNLHAHGMVLLIGLLNLSRPLGANDLDAQPRLATINI